MDSSFGFPPHYQPRPARNFDNVSQATSVLGISLKQVDIPCPFHNDEQSSNYCTEAKCHQPLCSECIEDHLVHHKKQGYSDLGIKSLRGLRKQCIGRLGALIEELVRRLELLESPMPPEQQLQHLETKLDEIRIKMHEIIESQVARLKESLRVALAESATYFKSMAEIHSRLEDLIEQLRSNHATLIDGNNRGINIPQCIKKTLTLDTEALMDSFQKQAAAYQSRRSKADLELSFQPELLRNCLIEAVKIVTPQSLNTSMISNRSRLYPRSKPNNFEQVEQTTSSAVALPLEATPRGKVKLLHFFETGSNKLHLISLENRKQVVSRTISISQFVVPSFHASLLSENGEFIFLSGGVVELNGGTKSPLFIRYSVRTQTCKKDFAKVKPRSSHSLCEDINGQIYILGGYGPSQFNGGDPTYQVAVEKVNPRSGRVEIEASSNWGGSNISMLVRQFILKASEQGIQLYNAKVKQWVIAEIKKSKNRIENLFFKNSGFACLNDSQVMVFGGYTTQAISSDQCFSWQLSFGDKPRVTINQINCSLPIPEGFENCSPLVDSQGFYVLQNIEDDEQDFCVDGERRLMRFNLHGGLGDWKIIQVNKFE